MSKQYTIMFVGLTVILWGCSTDSESEKAMDHEESALIEGVQNIAISEEVVQGIISSIPSPLELTTVIKESGSSFSKNISTPGPSRIWRSGS